MDWDNILSALGGGLGVVAWHYIKSWKANPYRWTCVWCISEGKAAFRVATNSEKFRDDVKLDHIKKFHPERLNIYDPEN